MFVFPRKTRQNWVASPSPPLRKMFLEDLGVPHLTPPFISLITLDIWYKKIDSFDSFGFLTFFSECFTNLHLPFGPLHCGGIRPLQTNSGEKYVAASLKAIFCCSHLNKTFLFTSVRLRGCQSDNYLLNLTRSCK